MQASTQNKLIVYYDKNCPFCAYYVAHVRIRDSAGTPELINVRENAAARDLMRQKDFDLDDGMVVAYGDRYYKGGDAIHFLALLSTRSGIFNRINRWIFSTRLLAIACYPFLRAGRNATLFFLGRQPIDPRQATSAIDQYYLFAFTFGLLSVYQFIYTVSYKLTVYPSGWLSLPLGIWLFLRPTCKRGFVLLVATLAVDSWLHAPDSSNHVIMLDFLLFTMVAAGVWHALGRQRSWEKWYEAVAPVGRCLLITMYFFGIFHKINSDFVNPESSCATALLRQIPGVLALSNLPWVQYAAIYGVFVIEGFVMVCLMRRRWHYYGVIVGISFHIVLAMSEYAFYPVFSTLSIMLHTLFIPRHTLARFRGSRTWVWLSNPSHRWLQAAAFLSLIVVQLALNIAHILWKTTTFRFAPWLLIAMAILVLVLRYGRGEEASEESSPLISRTWGLNLISILFFINGFSPYLGLKTSQSINMFANLHLEGGRSNHLIMRQPPSIFSYLSDVVQIIHVTEPAPPYRPSSGFPSWDAFVRATTPDGSASSRYRLRPNAFLVYYELLNILEKNPEIKISFIRRGQLLQDQSYATLKADADQTLHPRWVRKWLHFNIVNPQQPKTCSRFN